MAARFITVNPATVQLMKRFLRLPIVPTAPCGAQIKCVKTNS